MANEEHLALVRSGAEAINAFAQANENVALDLTDADLRGLDLRNAYLQYAKLANADLQDADLTNARLNSADMRGCNLRGATLCGANMHKAVFTGADLRGARFSAIGVGNQRVCIAPASFEGVRWEREELERILELINLNPDWEVRYQIVSRE
ncbi:MAG: pentapeptide repeat-containing protein [Dehalococcoidia bacterium]